MIGCLELCRGQVAQRRVDARVLVDIVQQAPDLRVGVGEVTVFGQRHLLLFDRRHESLGIAVLTRLTLLRHADVRADLIQARHIGSRGVLHALVGVVDTRLVSRRQRPLQSDKRERLIQMPRELPAAHGPDGDIHEHRQIDKLALAAHGGDVNGLLTNDKCCLTRSTRLHLSWARYAVWQQHTAVQRPCLPCSPSESTRRGGQDEIQDETSVASPPGARRDSGRATALGPGTGNRAYQRLLIWGQPPALPRPSQADQEVRERQEGPHARSGVGAGLDTESIPDVTPLWCLRRCVPVNIQRDGNVSTS